ncbi:DUF5655 domain-containing protein [Arthrobacter sp. Ld5]|uniref:DUF5655 domain-containing protein n=1 Tax=Arthrobacter sp. Ld5 TaxID=649152 RepID=UPI003EB89E86
MEDERTRTPEDLFAGFPDGLAICRTVQDAVSRLGGTSMTTTKSQIAFGRRRGFAYVWRPGQYVASDVPAVLSIALPRRVDSARFKEVAHPSATVWMHHLEIHAPDELDAEVLGWLADAYANAGWGPPDPPSTR